MAEGAMENPLTTWVLPAGFASLSAGFSLSGSPFSGSGDPSRGQSCSSWFPYPCLTETAKSSKPPPILTASGGRPSNSMDGRPPVFA